MMHEVKRKGATVCLTAAVILTSLLLQTTDCLRLKKIERRVVQRESDAASATGVQEGQIVFGEDSAEEPRVTEGTRKAPLNASVHGEAAYQADFPGWLKVTPEDSTSKDKWNRLATSLHCFGDHMKFRSLGSGASQFAVAQDNKQPLPVSMVPSKCGYNTHGNSLVMVMMVPYDGCGMVQQGGNYKLPLRWQGKPVSLLCPKHVMATAPKLQHLWLQRQGQGMPQFPPGQGMPQAPDVPQLPQGQGMPQFPHVPQFPSGQGMPQFLLGQGKPQTPQVPQSPPGQGKPQTPQVPQSPPGQGKPQTPQVPQSPPGQGKPQTPQVPQSPPGQGKPQTPQVPQSPPGQGIPHVFQYPFQGIPQTPQVPQSPPGQGIPHVFQYPFQGIPQTPQVPQSPPGQGMPQTPQVFQYPFQGIPQAPHVFRYPFQGMPQAPHVLQYPPFQGIPQAPHVPQLPPVLVMAPAPQVPPVHQLPEGTVLSHPLYHLYNGAAEHGGFPLYPQQPFHFLAPQSSTAEPVTTEAPIVTFPQIPFHSHFPWAYGPQFPNLMPALPHIPQLQYPETGVPEEKSTAAPYTAAPTTPSPTTPSPADVPVQFYSHEHLPFLPYEHMYHSYQG